MQHSSALRYATVISAGFLEPLLCMGVTFADFHSRGILPLLSDQLKNCTKAWWGDLITTFF